MSIFKNSNIYHTEYNLIQYDEFNFDIEKIKYCRQSGFELVTTRIARNSEEIVR